MIDKPSMIYRIFKCILDMFTHPDFYNCYVKLPPDNVTPAKIWHSSKLYPYLKKCHGSTNCSHIDSWVADEDMAQYQNWKGGITMNILAACTFDLWFFYVLSGWGGSAADDWVFDSAWKVDFAIPPGTFYLADAGFASCDSLLVPYHGVQYHLKEWGQALQKFAFISSITFKLLISELW